MAPTSVRLSALLALLACLPAHPFASALAPAPTPPSTSSPGTAHDEDLCQASYDGLCYDQKPFTYCCRVCSDGESKFRCDWRFRDRYTDLFVPITDNFTWDAKDKGVCELACGALGLEGNYFREYCPGGLVWQGVQDCPGAKASLAAMIPESKCPQFTGDESCQWQYDKVEANHQVATLEGDFSFDATDDACKDACVMLGLGSNAPSYYCPDGRVGRVLGTCSAAKHSVALALNKSSGWCPAITQFDLAKWTYMETFLEVPNSQHQEVYVLGTQTDPYPRTLNSAYLSTQTDLVGDPSLGMTRSQAWPQAQCQKAFDAKCYEDNSDWKSCCANCDTVSTAFGICNWAYTAPGGLHLHGQFDFPAAAPIGPVCFAVCSAIAEARFMPASLCMGGHIYNLTNECPSAQHDLAVNASKLCHDELGTMVLARDPLQMMVHAQDALQAPPDPPLQMHLLTACAGVVGLATFAALAAAVTRPRRRGEPLLQSCKKPLLE